MARSQTRRGVSLPRVAYVEASKFALRADKTLSQLTVDALRAFGVPIPETQHVPVEIAERAATAIRHGIVRREDKRDRRARAAIGRVRSAKITSSYIRIEHDGPIRRALSDAHADICGEPRWHEKVPYKAAA